MGDIFFATNRAPDPKGPNPPVDFGPGFHQLAMTFGKATVADPTGAAVVAGQLFPLADLTSQTFAPNLVAEMVAPVVDHLLISLHGFDYTFEELILRAANLQSWFAGGTPAVSAAVVALCWPSAGELDPGDYEDDYDRATQSGDAFRLLLLAMKPIIAQFRSTRRRVTLLAHSMGNHMLAAGLDSAIGTGPGRYDPAADGILFDQAILAGADEDIDALSHSDKLGPILQLATRTHLYYNNQDLALGVASRALHRAGRLGIDGPRDKTSFVGHGVTFVNCSPAHPYKADGTDLDPEWHQYYRTVPEVRDDICAMMRGLADTDANVPNRTFRQAENYYRLDLGAASKKAGYVSTPPIPTAHGPGRI